MFDFKTQRCHQMYAGMVRLIISTQNVVPMEEAARFAALQVLQENFAVIMEQTTIGVALME